MGVGGQGEEKEKEWRRKEGKGKERRNSPTNVITITGAKKFVRYYYF